jgi:hypothetical protein
MFYGILNATVKEFYIVTVQNGSHAHIRVINSINYNIRMDLGSSKDDIYYTLFKNTDPAITQYLLPMIEAHFNTDWVNEFNILAQSGTSGALDFFRVPILYSHISVSPGMTANHNNMAPSNTRVTDTTVGINNTQLADKYGDLAVAIRTMFTIYSNRKVLVFGRFTDAKPENIIRNVHFMQEVDKSGNVINHFTDGAIFFYDSANRLLDGIFTMTARQYNDFIQVITPTST